MIYKCIITEGSYIFYPKINDTQNSLEFNSLQQGRNNHVIANRVICSSKYVKEKNG